MPGFKLFTETTPSVSEVKPSWSGLPCSSCNVNTAPDRGAKVSSSIFTKFACPLTTVVTLFEARVEPLKLKDDTLDIVSPFFSWDTIDALKLIGRDSPGLTGTLVLYVIVFVPSSYLKSSNFVWSKSTSSLNLSDDVSLSVTTVPAGISVL